MSLGCLIRLSKEKKINEEDSNYTRNYYSNDRDGTLEKNRSKSTAIDSKT